MDIVLNHDGLVEYHSALFSIEQSRAYFSALESEIEWQPDELFLFGKQIITKRKVAWYGDQAYEYEYSNQKKIARPWTKTLQLIKAALETHTGELFNSCLLNYYHNGSESMGWHSDNEMSMKKNAAIASVSFGPTRVFQFRHKKTKEQHAINLENGSLLIMKGEVQQHWKHQLPARKRVLEPRINLTFRHFIS